MFILIFEQLVKMFFIMLLAILCYKIKLVNQEGNNDPLGIDKTIFNKRQELTDKDLKNTKEKTKEKHM